MKYEYTLIKEAKIKRIITPSFVKMWNNQNSHMLLRVSLVAQLVKNLPTMQKTLIQFLGQEYLLEKGQATRSSTLGTPGGSEGKESACNVGDLSMIPGLGRYPGKRKWQPTPVFLPGKFHEWRRSLAGYSPLGHKELDTTEQLHFHFHVSLVGR